MGKVELEASDSLFSWKSFKNPWKTCSLRVTSADMDVFAAVAKGRESAAKVCERSKYHYLCEICTEHDHKRLLSQVAQPTFMQATRVCPINS